MEFYYHTKDDVTEKSRAPALDVSNWSDILRDAADKDPHGRKVAFEGGWESFVG